MSNAEDELINMEIMADLVTLIEENRIEDIRSALDAGFDVNTRRDDDGLTLLLFACQADNLEIVTELLNRGANINEYDHKGFTPLIIASIRNNIDIVNELCLKGADVNIYDARDRCALFYACHEGNLAIVNKLILTGANVDAKDEKDITPLIEATFEGRQAVVKELILNGANINAKTNNGSTALMFACADNYVEIVKILCINGVNVNAQNNDGATTLLYTCKLGHEEIVNILLHYGADPNIGNVINMTPIMAAAYSNNDTIIRALISAGGRINEISTESTALMLASHQGNFEAVIALCEAGADKTVKTQRGQTAADRAKTEEIRAYLLNGTLPTVQMWKGVTQSDIKMLDTIFDTDAINYSTCPICLEYSVRQDGCMYMYHNCSKGKYFHNKLYNIYKSNEGNIYWCTICGRICHGHRHYKLVAAGQKKPELEWSVNPHGSDCRGEGGGGSEEKLARFRRLREYVLELDADIDKKPKRIALNQLVEQVWDAPLRSEKNLLVKIKNEKKWNISPERFRANVLTTNVANVNAPNVPFNGEFPFQRKGFNNISLEDNVDLLVFRHKQKNGTIKEHGITKEGLEDFIVLVNKQFGIENFGFCFNNQCDARLHPAEIKEHVTEAVYSEYKKKFNKKFLAQAGGGDNIFKEATDAMCVLIKKKSGGKKTRMKRRKVRRTRKACS